MVRGTKVEIFGLDYCIGTSEKKGEIHRRRGLQFRGLSVFALLYLLPVLPLASTGIRM